MNNVSFRGNIEIRLFNNGVMSKLITRETSLAQDRKMPSDLRGIFGKIPVYGEKNTDQAMSYLRKFVEDVTEIDLPQINSTRKYFHIDKTSTVLEEGIAKDKGHGDAYTIVFHPSRNCWYG